MQYINRNSIKNTFAHTWYMYPVGVALVSMIWIWSFYAFHQPSSHQKINIFFATDVRDDSFLKEIQNKHYDKEKLREVSHSYSLPGNAIFVQKLQIALTNTDMMILDEETLSGFKNSYGEQLVEISTYIKDNYLSNTHTYYDFDSKNYGIIIKEKNSTCYLSKYMTFDEEKDYYLVLNQASTNLGKVTSEDNSYYDNALTYMDYLLEGKL